MIDVDIVENNGLIALCTISGSSDEFKEDLARIKSIPFQDRDFVDNANPKYWRIRNAETYADHVVEIGDAIQIHKTQLRMF
jgi:hypothetical protein